MSETLEGKKPRLQALPMVAWTIAFVDALATAMLVPSISSRALELGADQTELIAMFVAYSLAQAVGAPCLGLAADLVSHEAGTRIALLGTAGVALALALAREARTLVVLRGALGLFHGTGSMLQVYVLHAWPGPGCAAQLGRLLAAAAAGQAAAASSLGLLPSPSSRARLGAAVCLCNALAGPALLGGAAPAAGSLAVDARPGARGREKHCHGQAKLGLAGTPGVESLALLCAAALLHALGVGAFQAAEIAYVQEAYSASNADIQTVVSAGGTISLAFLSFASQCASDIFGDAGVVSLGLCTCCLTYLGLAAGLPWPLAQVLLVLGASGAQAVACGLSSAIGAAVSPSLLGVSVGLLHAAGAFGMLLGPFVAHLGFALDHRMPFALAFAVSALALCCLCRVGAAQTARL